MNARIYIVGGPGGGKTTLAESLGRRLQVPVLRLDEHLDWTGLSGGARLERDSAGHPSEAMLAARHELLALTSLRMAGSSRAVSPYSSRRSRRPVI